MSCCGQKRASWSGAVPQRPGMAISNPHTPSAAVAPPRLLRLVYEYVGSAALSIASSRTGRRYRFDRPGARLEVDPRDRPLLAGLPQLRQVL